MLLTLGDPQPRPCATRRGAGERAARWAAGTAVTALAGLDPAATDAVLRASGAVRAAPLRTAEV
ncbi:MAG TPA: hypothetical protein VNV66_05105 [Pilimelia sp.]|nr:hypothetical protein [Pilimelia sp.]